jgi:manganese/iron transport system permease protein
VSWLTEPWTSDLVARAGVELVIVGILGGALGVFVVVRGMAYTVEAFAHTALPGAVLAVAAGGSLVLGGLVAALVAAAGITLAARSGRTNDDTAVGVVFTGMFALGVLLIAVLGPLERDVSSFLFGSVLGVTRNDLVASAGVTAVVLLALVALRLPLAARSFDREAAAGAGVAVGPLDAAFLGLLALGVVVSTRSIGNVLVLGLFITPAVAARLVTRRLGSALATAVGLGVVSGLGGLYASYHAGIAAGGAVVLTATALLAVTWLASPRAGLPAALRRARAVRPAPR